MPIVKVSGSRDMIAKMRRDVKGLKNNVTATHRNLLKMMLRDLVAHTPQWSGELALHWGLEFHGYSAPEAYSVRNPGWQGRREGSIPQLQDPYRMGDDPAVSMAVAREMQKLQYVRYNSKVTFVNKMPYASDVERGEGPNGKPLRDVNRLAGYAGAAMIGYLQVKYSDKAMIRKAVPK